MPQACFILLGRYHTNVATQKRAKESFHVENQENLLHKNIPLELASCPWWYDALSSVAHEVSCNSGITHEQEISWNRLHKRLVHHDEQGMIVRDIIVISHQDEQGMIVRDIIVISCNMTPEACSSRWWDEKLDHQNEQDGSAWHHHHVLQQMTPKAFSNLSSRKQRPYTRRFQLPTGWRRCIGYLRLRVSFR